MRVYNQTRFIHEKTMGMDVAGREFLSVVVRGTWDFPAAGAAGPTLAAEQTPLVAADIATGEPGYSATLWETDFAFRKPHAEVILQGAAYAPHGKKAERVRVGVRVGNWQKQFDVVGYREWQVLGPVVRATRPVPFQRLPFGYDVAFGGVDRLDPDDAAPAAYLPNPVGRGFASARNQDRLSGLALPHTERVGENITSPYADYTPMAFGPVGRGWPERVKFGGTYDQDWIDNTFPFLPTDFDERYYQSAAADQWMPGLPPAAGVSLVGLTPSGREDFRLPDTGLPVTLFQRGRVCQERVVPADTLLIDSEARQFSLVWRIEERIKSNFLEFDELWLGPPTAPMQRARAQGKSYLRAMATTEPTEGGA